MSTPALTESDVTMILDLLRDYSAYFENIELEKIEQILRTAISTDNGAEKVGLLATFAYYGYTITDPERLMRYLRYEGRCANP